MEENKMINRRFAKKLTTVSLAGILTASMSVAAFAGPGGGPGGPGGGGGGNRGGGDGGSRTESHESGESRESSGGGEMSRPDSGSSDSGFAAPSFGGGSSDSGFAAPSFGGGSTDSGMTAPSFGGGSFEAPTIDVENQTFSYGGNTYSLATGELLSTVTDSTDDTDSSDTQQPSTPPAMGQQRMTPPAMGQQQMTPPAQLQEGEEPPEKPEGDLAPAKPEGDLAPEKPEGAEELMEPPVDEDGNVIAPPEKPEGEEGEGFAPGGMRPVMIDTDALSEAIAAIEDEDTSASLSELLSVYTAAMDAEKAALDAEDTDEETLTSLREAAAEARTALLDALKEADIDVADYSDAQELPERPGGEGEELQTPPEKPEGDLTPEKPEGDEAPEKPATDEDESVSTGSVSMINRARTALQNMASSIGNWFGGFFR